MRTRLFLALCFTLFFLLMYPSAELVVSLNPYQIRMTPPNWPFLPQLAPLYLSLNLLLPVAFFCLSEKRAGPFLAALIVQTLIAWPLFVLFPLSPIEPPSHPQSLSYQWADMMNMDRNYFPSLHAAYAVTCLFFLRHPLVGVWSAGIAASTFLTYQHYPVDTLAGVLLACLAGWWAQGRGRAVGYCLYEMGRYTVRHGRYGLIAVALLLYSLVSPRRGWQATVGFCYLQRLDDIQDGHLAWEGEPEDEARRQKELWSNLQFGNSILDTLAATLHRTALPEQAKLPLIIEEMRVDRQRVRHAEVWSGERLQEHLVRTFQLSLDLMLSAARAELRSEDVPTLAPLLGWCSVVRDLEEDLALGLVNIPLEVVEQKSFERWVQDETKRASALYEQAKIELAAVRGRSGYRLLHLFHGSVKKYLDRIDPVTLSKLAESYVRDERKKLPNFGSPQEH